MTIYEIAFWVFLGIAAAYGIICGAKDVWHLFFAENDDSPFEPDLDFIPKSLKRHL